MDMEELGLLLFLAFFFFKKEKTWNWKQICQMQGTKIKYEHPLLRLLSIIAAFF